MIKNTIFMLIAMCISSSLISAQTTYNKPAKPVTEEEKIELLINSVEQLLGAQFYRNGEWYDATTAADHLRMKLSKAGSRVKTTQDFIDKVASESSMTGEAYKIKYSDGKVVTTKEYFTGKLKELEGK
jgi:hypothetical protein